MAKPRRMTDVVGISTRDRFELEYGRMTCDMSAIRTRSETDLPNDELIDVDQGLYIPTKRLIPKSDITARRCLTDSILAATCGINLMCVDDDNHINNDDEGNEQRKDTIKSDPSLHAVQGEPPPSPHPDSLYFACN